jgi:hypothetical protein
MHHPAGENFIAALSQLYQESGTTEEDRITLAQYQIGTRRLPYLAINDSDIRMLGLAFRYANDDKRQQKGQPAKLRAQPRCHACRFLFDIPWQGLHEETKWG